MRLDPADPRVPSLAALSFPAGRFEREMRDLFGIVPDGHPLPRRLVRHFHWPRGWYPMLADAGPPPTFGDLDGPYPFRAVEGAGVYEIPVGPVHAGLIEPGHFRFSVVGETILNLKARLWFVHRGLEKLFQAAGPSTRSRSPNGSAATPPSGTPWRSARPSRTRSGSRSPRTSRRLRAILLELERLYNHVADIGALCNDVGHGILNAHAQRIRERLLRLNEHVTGHRLLRGAIGLGGATVVQLPDPSELAEIAADIAEVVGLALGHSVVRDRFAGTAVLTREQAADLGALGYVARASGLDVDARRDHPTLAAVFSRPTHQHTGGDVLARFCVRAEEIAESVGMITALVDHLGDVLPVARAGPVPDGTAGRGSASSRVARHHRAPRRARRRRHPDPGQDRRPELLQLARAAGRPRRHDRSRLPAGQQELQPVLRR